MPNVSTIPFLKPHFHGNDGSPATSYKLYTFDSTTQDAIPVYKDPGGTIEYPNPVILNSRGEPDGMGLYLDNTKVYKMVLKTDLDAPVWTVNAVQGVNGNGGTSVPVINLPGYSVLGNDTENYGAAGPIDIANTIASNTDSRDIPNVGALVDYTKKYLENSGDHTYNGNLVVAGKLDANAIETNQLTINDVPIGDMFVAKDGHAQRSLVGNAGEDSMVEDVPLVNSLTSNSPNEVPSVQAVKTSIDSAVDQLEQQISQVDSGRVKVDESDSANYLESKLVQGNRVQITKVTEGGEDKLRLDLNLDDLKDISYVFQAYSVNAGWAYPTNGAIFSGYDSDPVNFGEGFSPETGKFTAIEAGYYHFDASALINQGGTVDASTCNMYLSRYNSSNELQGQSVGFITTPPSGSSHPNSTIAVSANFHLTEGDYVCLVFNVYNSGTILVNRVAFGGYSLDSANGASVSGTPFRLAWYDRDGRLNPNQELKFDDRYNQLYGHDNETLKDGNGDPLGADGVAIGAHNRISTNDCVAIGTNNQAVGGSYAGLAYAFGNKNQVSAPDGYAIGYSNEIGLVNAGHTMGVGMDIKLDGFEMMAVGTDITAGGAASVVVGKDITAPNTSGNVIVGKDLTVNSSSYNRVIVGSNLSDTNMPSATKVAVGTGPGDYMTMFGRYVDQFGTYGNKGRFLGFDVDMKVKVTNEVSDIKFLTDAGVTPTEGQLAWNELDHTLNIGLSNGSILQVGQEEVVYAVNQTGQTIYNGQVVYVSGSQGNRVVVEFAQATTQPTQQVFIAVATQNIDNNQMGYFTRFGLVRDLNTSAYNEGDILWVATSKGDMSSSKPNKPYTQIAVAIVTRAHQQNGTIMVSPYVVPRLSQLTDVDTTGATNGQALVYQSSTGLWVPGDATGGVSDGKVKVTAADTAGYLGTKLTSSDHTVSIDVSDTEIDLKVKVNASESKFATEPVSSAAGGNVQWGELEFGNWTVSGSDVIAPVTGTHQINLIGKLLYDHELDSSNAFMGTMSSALFSNVSNDIIQWSYCDFGNWNGTRDVLTFEEDGKVQLNISFKIYTSNATNTNKQSGDITVKHYRINGTFLRQYTASSVLTGLASQSGYYYDTVDHSEVVEVLSGDYFVAHMTSTGNGYITDVRMNGGMLSNMSRFAGNTASVRLNHKDSQGTVKSSVVVYEGMYPYAGYKSFSLCKVFEVEEGDRFYVNYTPSPNISAMTDVVLSGVINQATSVSSGNGGSTIDGIQSFAIIASNATLSMGHTSDQGSTYTSARVIPAGLCVATYISCFATQVGSFYGLRMGIYTPGPSGDTLIAQTGYITTLPATGGIITLPLLYDAAGVALASPLELQPNVSYMLAADIKANACNFLAYQGVSTNPPNHFGRKDDWNAPNPTSNLMPTTASYSQTNTFLWMSVSK